MKYFYVILFLVLFSTNSSCQFTKSCSAHDHFEQKLQNDQVLQLNYEKIQNQILEYLNNAKDQDGNILIIPVVFQIIHNGDVIGVQENLSEILINEQLQQLNDDFSRMNSDAINTPDEFLSVAANTQIQFCLAEVDPTGNTTTGIVRTHIDNLSNVSESDCWTPSYIDANIVTPLIWNRNDYLNIFSVIGIDDLVNGSCETFSILGYAQFPGGSASTDAVIVSFYSIGSLDMPNPLVPSFLGRTCTHEVGHWLSLSHVWGNGNASCVLDDGIIDTPSQFDATSNCPLFPAFDNCTANGDGIMFMNYMDYSSDQCMNLFTVGQRGLMRATIFNARSSLLTSPCEAEMVLSIPPSINANAELKEFGIDISWELSSSFIADSFSIERSFDLNNFETIAANYFCHNEIYCNYIDNIDYGPVYYRVKGFLSNDETISSEIVVVRLDNDMSNIVIYPNPSSEFINFKYLNFDQKYEIEIFNSFGILSKKVTLDNNKSINVNDLRDGIYFVSLTNLSLNSNVKKSTLMKLLIAK